MKKIFWRAGFIPLPLWERAGVRGILFSAFLIAAGSVAAFGQNTAPSATAKESRLMSSAVKKGFEKRKVELLMMLADYHAGKYTDIQGHAILVQILFACGQLKEKQSPDCQSALKEYQALNKSHPEFQNPPEFHKKYPNLTASDLLNIELPSQKSAREAQEKKDQDVKEMAKNFVPKDTAITGIYGREHYLLLVYQYHIEFYALPLGISVKSAPHPHVHFLTLYEGNKNIPPSGFLRNSDVKHVLSQLNINKPVKVMSFKHPLQYVSPFPSKPKKFFWVCENLVGKYHGSTDQEDNILKTKYQDGEMTWSNESAEYHDFCGSVSWDGKIIYQLPFRQRNPDTAVFVGPLNPQATSIILTVNEITNSITSNCISKSPFENGYDPCEDAPEPGLPVRLISKPKEYLLYVYPDDLKTFKVENRSQYIKTLQRHGFSLKNLKRYGI